MKTEQGFIALMNEFNYYTGSVAQDKKSPLYSCYNAFIVTNQDILTPEQLNYAEANLLPPKCFDDSNIRSESDYYNTVNRIRDINIQMNQNKQGRSMAA